MVVLHIYSVVSAKHWSICFLSFKGVNLFARWDLPSVGTTSSKERSPRNRCYIINLKVTLRVFAGRDFYCIFVHPCMVYTYFRLYLVVTNSCRWGYDMVLSIEWTRDFRLWSFCCCSFLTSHHKDPSCCQMCFLPTWPCLNEAVCLGRSAFISSFDDIQSSSSSDVRMWKCHVMVMWSLVVSFTQGEVRCKCLLPLKNTYCDSNGTQ